MSGRVLMAAVLVTLAARVLGGTPPPILQLDNLPLLVVGAMKAGTSAMCEILSTHPQILNGQLISTQSFSRGKHQSMSTAVLKGAASRMVKEPNHFCKCPPHHT